MRVTHVAAVVAVLALSSAFIVGAVAQNPEGRDGGTPRESPHKTDPSVSNESNELTPGYPTSVSFDGRALKLNDTRVLLLSGGVHYPRVVPADWPRIFADAKALGLNTVQTYVFWNQHEPTGPGEVVWDGNADLRGFIDAAAAAGLWVAVRIGPYICGEYYYGGIPLWMRDVTAADGTPISCFRCQDAAWKEQMARWTAVVVDYLRPQFAPNGGPIVFLQIENEYDTHGDASSMAYLQWSVAMARNLTTELPWNLCHDVKDCTVVNQKLGANSALCTINGFWIEEASNFQQQPSPVWTATQRNGNPSQPLMWTEDQAWFDMWGNGQKVRDPADVIYGIARAVAYGFSYHNFYMMHGGSQWGFIANRNSVTAYAPDAVVDSWMLRHEPRYTFYQGFFTALQQYAEILVSSPISPAKHFPSDDGSDALLGGQEYHEYGNTTAGGLAFLSNMDAHSWKAVVYRGTPFSLPPHCVLLIDMYTLGVVFNTSYVGGSASTPAEVAGARASGWQYYKEPFGQARQRVDSASGPVEQLSLTNSRTDWMWYNVSLPGNVGEGGQKLSLKVQGVCQVYLDGVFVGEVDDQDADDAGEVHVEAPMLRGSSSLSVMCAAMGMNNVGVTPKQWKGVGAASVGGVNVTGRPWTMQWNMSAEAAHAFSPEGVNRVAWQGLDAAARNASAVWFKAEFDKPDTSRVGAAQTAYALDLSPMGKGMVWFNGFNLGRYWLLPGQCSGACAPPMHDGVCSLYWKDGSCGKPTQHLYAVPLHLVKPSGNLVVLFEEGPAPAFNNGTRNVEDVKLVALHAHPVLD